MMKTSNQILANDRQSIKVKSLRQLNKNISIFIQFHELDILFKNHIQTAKLNTQQFEIKKNFKLIGEHTENSFNHKIFAESIGNYEDQNDRQLVIQYTMLIEDLVSLIEDDEVGEDVKNALVFYTAQKVSSLKIEYLSNTLQNSKIPENLKSKLELLLQEEFLSNINTMTSSIDLFDLNFEEEEFLDDIAG